MAIASRVAAAASAPIQHLAATRSTAIHAGYDTTMIAKRLGPLRSVPPVQIISVEQGMIDAVIALAQAAGAGHKALATVSLADAAAYLDAAAKACLDPDMLL